MRTDKPFILKRHPPYTEVDKFAEVKSFLVQQGYTFEMAELRYLPQNMTKLTDADSIKNMEKLLDLLEDNDDVQNVYHNWEMEERD